MQYPGYPYNPIIQHRSNISEFVGGCLGHPLQTYKELEQPFILLLHYFIIINIFKIIIIIIVIIYY